MWIRLPDVHPAHIKAAISYHGYFTGKLDASVHSFTHFAWTEAQLLRAQISRITHSTNVAPVGFIKPAGGVDLILLISNEAAPLCSFPFCR